MKLLERDAQLEMFGRLLQRAAGRQGVCALVHGEAGIGKTSLVHQLIATYGERMNVLLCACESLFTPRPLGPLVDLADRFPPSLSSALHSGHTYNGLFPAMLTYLQDSAKPSLLIIEDMHWADESTLDFVRYIGRRLANVPAVLLLTYREEEVTSAHPLRRVLGDLPTSLATRIPLKPLSRQAVEHLAKQSKHSSAGLYESTAGNPFYVTEVLATEGTSLPPSVLDAVIARLGRISKPARELLDVCSVVPNRIELAIVDRILPDADSRIDECQAAGVLLYESPYLQFRHELARQAVEQALVNDQRLRWHRKVYDVLCEPTSHFASLSRLVHHAEHGRLTKDLAMLAPRAAREAAAASSHREAATLFRLALKHVDQVRPTIEPIEHAALLEEAAEEFRQIGSVADGLQSYQQALELYQSTEARLSEAQCLTRLTLLQYREVGDAKASLEQFKAVLSLLEKCPHNLAELATAHASLSEMYSHLSQFEVSMAHGEQALALAEKSQNPIAMINALRANASVTSALRSDPEARLQFEKAIEIALQYHLEGDIAHLYATLQTALLIHREHTYAIDVGNRGIAFCESRDLDAMLMRLLDRRSMSYIDLGRWSEADADIERCLQFPELSVRFRKTIEFLRNRLEARRGVHNAQDYWLEIEKDPESLLVEYRVAGIALACAEAAWLRGDVAMVKKMCELGLQHSLKSGDGRLSGPLLAWLKRIDAPLPTQWPTIAPAYAAEVAGDITLAAQEWAKLSCPYERALALLGGNDVQVREALEVFEALGAKPAVEIARQTLRRLGARTITRGPQPRTKNDPLGLTTREREVFELIVKGASNAAMAAQLHRSERTVEHHVATLYTKLQVRSRQELLTRYR